MERILLPVDGSEQSRKAVHCAVELAENTGASVDLVHVLPTELALYGFIAEGTCPNLDQIEKKWEDRGRQILEKMAKEPHGNVRVTTRLEKGYASDIILRLARSGQYKMIVMGSKGAGWLKRVIYGSICSDVVEHAACPVLVVH